MSGAGAAGAIAVEFWIRCGAHHPLDEAELRSLQIDQDLGEPDVCVLGLGELDDDQVELGDEVEVRLGGPSGTGIFQGEVVGFEASHRAGQATRRVVRAYDRLHRLSRGQRSRTFVARTDADIARTIAGDHGLAAEVDPSPVVHAHVYQHNQSDLELLRERAARCGHELGVRDRTLTFRRPPSAAAVDLELRLHDPEVADLVQSFAPRLSSARVVQAVEVRGWDPVRKIELTARATAGRSAMGARAGADEVRRGFGTRTAYVVDVPIASVEEARVVAERELAARLRTYITAELTLSGRAALRAGQVISIKVEPDRASRFDGRYRVVAASHRYGHGEPGRGRGYTTALRLVRDAEGAP